MLKDSNLLTEELELGHVSILGQVKRNNVIVSKQIYSNSIHIFPTFTLEWILILLLVETNSQFDGTFLVSDIMPLLTLIQFKL